MTQIERLKKIYDLLTQGALTKKELIEKLAVSLSVKQIERDLKDLEKNYLRHHEQLQVGLKAKQKVYFIQTKAKKKKIISVEELAVIDMLLTSNNKVLFKNFTKEMSLFEKLTNALQEVYGKESFGLNQDVISATGFYQLNENKDFEAGILKIYEAIITASMIQVGEIFQDVTSENPERKKTRVKLIPLKIIYHRGDFYVAVLERNKLATYEIAQFKNIEILDKKFKLSNYENYLAALNKRFGISKNMNENVYDIKLQFSESTGSFVSKMQWHATQKIKQLPNKNYLLEMQCGINRELLGWIFQWMDNVKVISPPELQKIHLDICENISKSNPKKTLESLNHF